MTPEDPRVRQLCQFLSEIASSNVNEVAIAVEAKTIIFSAPFAMCMDLPCAKPVTENQARQELSKLADLASDLARHLQSMHSTSLDAIRVLGSELKIGGLIPFPDPIILLVNAEKIAFVAHRAKEATSFQGSSSRRSTKPTKLGARKVAELSAISFMRITGRPPTIPKKDGVAYGQFCAMLKLVFALTGFQGASAENMGREAIKAMEKSRLKSTRKLL